MTHVDGVRDDNYPCAAFVNRKPTDGFGTCATDGHYVCRNCKHIRRVATISEDEARAVEADAEMERSR